jgi:hypothetical protein
VRKHGALELSVADVEADLLEVVLDAVAGSWRDGRGLFDGQSYPFKQGGLLCRRESLVCLSVVFRVHPWIIDRLGSRRLGVVSIVHCLNSFVVGR